MAADAALTDADPETTLFAYIVARADPSSLADTERLAAWTAAEDERERLAGSAGGRYYPPTAVGAVAEALVVAEDAIANAGPADRDAVIATTSGRTLAQGPRHPDPRPDQRTYPKTSMSRSARLTLSLTEIVPLVPSLTITMFGTD